MPTQEIQELINSMFASSFREYFLDNNVPEGSLFGIDKTLWTNTAKTPFKKTLPKNYKAASSGGNL